MVLENDEVRVLSVLLVGWVKMLSALRPVRCATTPTTSSQSARNLVFPWWYATSRSLFVLRVLILPPQFDYHHNWIYVRYISSLPTLSNDPCSLLFPPSAIRAAPARADRTHQRAVDAQGHPAKAAPLRARAGRGERNGAAQARGPLSRAAAGLAGRYGPHDRGALRVLIRCTRS